MKAKTKTELEFERQIRSLIKLMSERGLLVRREKLSRGYSYRVKSGKCHLTGKELLFVDRRLPLEQQLALLHDASHGIHSEGASDGIHAEGASDGIHLPDGVSDEICAEGALVQNEAEAESAKESLPLSV